LALDGSGNIYITGYTTSTNFPVKNASQSKLGGLKDAYLLKFDNSASTIIFSTFLGGSQDDRAFGLAVDPAGNAFVAGTTSSTNFPVANAFQSKNGGGLADAF